MIEIKSRNVLEVPKKILIKNNVFSKVSVKTNLLKESLGRVENNKPIYNINLSEYMKWNPQLSAVEIDGKGFYLGSIGTGGFYDSDMSKFENTSFGGEVINYTYANGDTCDVFKLAVVEETFYNENGIRDIFDLKIPKLISSIDTNILYADGLTFKANISKTETVDYETISNDISPIFNDTSYDFYGTQGINNYDKVNFIISYRDEGVPKTIDLKNSQDYRENFLEKGYQNVYIITNAYEGSFSVIHIFPCLYFPNQYTNRVALNTIFDKVKYGNGEYSFAVVSNFIDAAETNLISIENKTISYGSGTSVFDLTTNELFQVKNISETAYFQPVVDRILSKYVNGKETIIFKCALANYYDNLGVLKYDKTKGEYISNGEVIRLYIKKRNQEVLFSSKNFLVTSSRLTYANGYAQIEIEAEETELIE